MKPDIHPELKPSRMACTCGSVVETFSTLGDITLEICSGCHPFFTGQQKVIDTAGRVDRFNKKYAKAQNPAKK